MLNYIISRILWIPLLLWYIYFSFFIHMILRIIYNNSRDVGCTCMLTSLVSAILVNRLDEPRSHNWYILSKPTPFIGTSTPSSPHPCEIYHNIFVCQSTNVKLIKAHPETSHGLHWDTNNVNGDSCLKYTFAKFARHAKVCFMY